MPDDYNGRGTEDMLADLHGLMASYFKDVLSNSRATGEPLPPATLNAIRQFLKDNGIDCVGRNNADMNDITRDLPTFEEDEAGEGISPGLLN
ncbi:hypothetical protein [uncultured Desulfovibrio sp.]|uniref:hypothetical protein n=1 Tax=uncultured Desulfovibrio sp. TaxID=167968 RepID=UPI0026299E7D|nr:hypothetical protein [uncultured Desulfovibrio sp.]